MNSWLLLACGRLRRAGLVIRHAVVVALCLTALAGCERLLGLPGDAAAAGEPNRSNGAVVSVAADAINYRHDRGVSYTLYDLSQTPPLAVGGGITDRLVSGGSKGCCVALPKVWKPGLKVLVKWTESDLKQSYPEQYTRELEIPRYEQPADLYVVFYEEHDVEVVVSRAEPGNPEWAGRIKSTPWQNCLATQGRKPCKAALPKLFDAEGSQGYCTYLKQDNPTQLEDNCGFATMECLRDYEDEAFCKKVLWGPRRKGL